MNANTKMLNESVVPSKDFANVHVSFVDFTLSFIVNIRTIITLRTPIRIKHDKKLVLANFEMFLSKLSGRVTNADIKQITK